MKKSFHPYQNKHDSVEETGEKGKNLVILTRKVPWKSRFTTHLPFLSYDPKMLKAFPKAFPSKIKKWGKKRGGKKAKRKSQDKLCLQDSTKRYISWCSMIKWMFETVHWGAFFCMIKVMTSAQNSPLTAISWWYSPFKSLQSSLEFSCSIMCYKRKWNTPIQLPLRNVIAHRVTSSVTWRSFKLG